MPCQRAFVDNTGHCLFAATGTEWIISYASVMQSSSTSTVASAIPVKECPVLSVKFKARLVGGWISYQQLVW